MYQTSKHSVGENTKQMDNVASSSVTMHSTPGDAKYSMYPSAAGITPGMDALRLRSVVERWRFTPCCHS